MSHTISYEKNQIKITFDKDIPNWQYRDKYTVKSYYLDSYKEHGSILYAPSTAYNFRTLMQKLQDNPDYDFTDSFLNQYPIELKKSKDLKTKLDLLKEKVTYDTIESRPDLLDYTHLPDDIKRPFKHQKIHLEYAVRMPAYYNLDEMGLGKTRVAIERHIFLKTKLNKIDKSFIICPVSLMYNWIAEIEKWAPHPINKSYHIITGSKKQKIEELNLTLKQDINFYIINYEGIDSIKQELLNLIDSRTNIIIDEFIKIKNPSALRSKNIRDITDNTEYIFALCGTPVSQGSIDLFSPSLIVDKGKKYGFSYERFIDKYFIKYGFKLDPRRSTYQELSNKLYENALRFTKKQCLDIPDKLYSQILIDLPEKNQLAYNQMLQFCLSELEGHEATAPIILVQLLRLSQITSGFIKDTSNNVIRFKEQPKLDALSDLLDQNNSHSMLIWSRFVPDIKLIAKMLIDKNVSFGIIIGSQNEFTAEDNPKKDSTLQKIIDLLNPEHPITPQTIKKAYHLKVKELHPDFNSSDPAKTELLKNINALYNSLNKFKNVDIPTDAQLQQNYDIPYNMIGIDAFTRQNIVDKFQANKIQVIIGTASSGGIGFNMTAASTVIYYANDYSLINRLQSEDRAHRTGQRNKVNYYDIIARNTIDISILNVLMGKKDISDIITRDNIRNFANGTI